METLHFPSFPVSSSRAHIALFSSLSPSTLSNLRQQIVDASLLPPSDSPDCTPAAEAQRESVNFAFLNPHLITSKLHLQTAIYQAILAETGSALRTKTVHSEILWALNPTNNVRSVVRAICGVFLLMVIVTDRFQRRSVDMVFPPTPTPTLLSPPLFSS